MFSVDGPTVVRMSVPIPVIVLTVSTVAMAADMGVKLEGTLHTYSTAAIGMTYRVGLGKVRHVRVQHLRCRREWHTRSLD